MANPVFKRMVEQSEHEVVIDANSVMTINGTIQTTFILGLIVLISAAFCWSRYSLGYTDLGAMLTGGGAIVGFILALIICLGRVKALIPAYALAEGLFLGGISSIFETSYPGIVVQAVMGTFAAFFAMLLLYRMGFIACTDKFRSVVIISTFSIAGIYLVDIIGHFFGFAVPVINSSSNFGILVSVIIVVIAALNLIIDFDFIERGAQMHLPKDYEWFGAFGLLVTIVWLYIEILKLLAKASNRR